MSGKLIDTKTDKVIAEGTPAQLYDALADLKIDSPEDAARYAIEGYDHTELPDKEPGKHRRKK